MPAIEILPNYLTPDNYFDLKNSPFSPKASENLLTRQCNREILSELSNLSDIRGENGQGCWLVASCYIRDYFGLPLPPAQEIWSDFRDDFDDVLDPEILNVSHEKFGEAFEKYDEWGIKVKSYRLNKIAFNLIGESMKIHGKPENQDFTFSNKSLPVEDLDYPYCTLLHRAGTCSTHILAITDDVNTKALLEYFQKKNYRIIAEFMFEEV